MNATRIKVAIFGTALAFALAPAASAGAKGKKKRAPVSGLIDGEAIPTGPGPRMDIVFVVDNTGSMGGEIDTVKAELRKMTADILAGDPKPDVRFGAVKYKDKGDDYRVHRLPLTRDFDAVYDYINGMYASGGGDGPESNNLALETAVMKMDWEEDRNVAKMVFLIGDAPGHAYKGEKHYKAIAKVAKKEAIIVNTIACRDWAEMVTQFTEIAKLTGGEFTKLSYAEVAKGAGGRDVTIMTDGDDTYVADEVLSEKEWKKGVKALRKSGKLRRAKSADFAAGAAAAPASIGRGKSDLGRVMTESAKKAAKKKGVKY